jgi:hypothetical protein
MSLFLDHLFQIGPVDAQMRQAIEHVLHVEAVQVVLYSSVEGRRNDRFLLVTPTGNVEHVHVMLLDDPNRRTSLILFPNCS